MDRQELYEEYQEQQKFEHELINRRVNWLLTSQSILFAAYALAISEQETVNEYFLCIVALTGLASSFLLFMGIFANVMAKCCSWRDYNEIKSDFEGSLVSEQLKNLRKNWGVRTWITLLALSPDILLPMLFFGAWAYVVKSHAIV